MNTVMKHEDSWLLLPWLANGRIAAPERARLEEHLRACADCAGEFELQRLMCRTLTEPDRVTYAPGPSFRKLMERIDGREAAPPERRAARVRRFAAPVLSAWRPPGFAFAASFVAALGLAMVAATAYRWSLPLYGTRSDPPSAAAPAPVVLHIYFNPSLPVGAVEEALHAAGARLVEGPDADGELGVTAAGSAQPDAHDLDMLARRLRTDPRVLWVQPLAATDAAPPPDPGTRER